MVAGSIGAGAREQVKDSDGDEQKFPAGSP